MSPDRLLRTLRHLGIAVLVFAVPSAVVVWATEGVMAAVLALAAHLYVGGFAAFGLPWFLRRQRQRVGRSANPAS